MTRYIDRSRITSYWHCPRKRYWNYEFNSKGIVKSSTSLPLFTGISVHDSLATIAQFTKDGTPVPIDDICKAAFDAMKQELMEAADGEVGAHDFAMEQATLVEGLIRGFYKHTWPLLMETYPQIVAIEQEMEYDLGDDMIFMAKPDLIVEDKNGELVYIEYKTTSSKKQEWIDSWNTAVQLHSSIKAAEQTLGKAPSQVQIVGLYKGYVSYGKQSSPFCYAYMKKGSPPFTQDIVSYEWKAGLKRYPTWELEGGIQKWVDDMPMEVLANQFPMTPPIYVNEDLVNDFFKQAKLQETEIANATRFMSDRDLEDNTNYLNKVFPQRFDKCVPSFGYACEFRKLCHGHCNDPLEEGYEFRKAHHAQEAEQFGEEL